jgi:EmrB/QacA subfamily drug resistance transporter
VKRFLSLKSRTVIVVVAASMFMAQLDGAVLAVALPRIADDFGVPAVSLSLAITIYLTMLVAMLPVSGWAADRFGPRRVFLSAIVGFATFSLLCAAAESYWPFVLARALQGASAALLTPVSRLILLRGTPKDELVDALAITAMPMLVAPTVGPSIGGFIVDYARWEYIFLLNLPVAAALFVVTLLTIPAIAPETGRRFDAFGAALVSGALVFLLTGFDRLAGGFARPLPWLLLALGAGCAGAAIRHLKRHPDPILSLGPMTIPGFRTAAIGAGALVRLPGRAMLFALPLMFQLGFGFSAFVAGLLLMALNGGDLLTKPLVRPLYDRFGYRETVVWASVLGLAGLVAIAVAVPGEWLVPLLLAALVAAGIARSLVFTGMASLSFATLDKAHMSSGNVLASISMQLFNALSISVTAILLTFSAGLSGHAEPVMSDYRFAMIAIVGIGFAATLALYRRLPRKLSELHPDETV